MLKKKDELTKLKLNGFNLAKGNFKVNVSLLLWINFFTKGYFC